MADNDTSIAGVFFSRKMLEEMFEWFEANNAPVGYGLEGTIVMLLMRAAWCKNKDEVFGDGIDEMVEDDYLGYDNLPWARLVEDCIVENDSPKSSRGRGLLDEA